MLTHTSGATIAAVGLSTTHEDDLACQGGDDGLRVHLQAHLRHSAQRTLQRFLHAMPMFT